LVNQDELPDGGSGLIPVRETRKVREMSGEKFGHWKSGKSQGNLMGHGKMNILLFSGQIMTF
jgi:hypothetical protein